MMPLFGSLGPLGRRVGGGGPAVLLTDTFTGVDGTVLTSRTADTGQSYTAIFAPAPVLAGDKLRSGGSNSSAVADVGVADCTVTIDYTYATGELFSGLLLRATNSSNYWRLSYNQAAAPQWVLQERNGGANTTRATGTLLLVNGQTYQLKAVLSGAAITFYIDSVQILTYASATFNQSVTRFGPFLHNIATNARMDNFQVTTNA